MLWSLTNALWLAAAAVPVAITYCAILLTARRRFYKDLPGPPHSFLWGHLKVFGQYVTKLPAGGYIQAAVTQIKQDYDLPEVFYLDLWPAANSFVVLTSPDAVAIPTTLNNYEQPPAVTNFFVGNHLGDTFIEVTNGALWKELHGMMAPGLTPSMVRTYHRAIVEDAKASHDRFMATAVKGGTIASMHEEVGRYPFGVIGRVFFGDKLSDTAYHLTLRSSDLAGENNAARNFAFSPFAKRRWDREVIECHRKLEDEIKARAHARYAALRELKQAPNKSTPMPVIDRILLAQAQTGRPLDERTMRIVVDNALGFIIAGYGTTTDTTTYMCMLLSTSPEALKKLREEHDRVFPKSFDETVAMLHESPMIINNLEYTTAVINETLRMYPIGLSARKAPDGMKHLTCQGKKYPLLPNHLLGIFGHSMNYSPDHFPEPKLFNPDRFLARGADGEPTYARNAYRPFERGVRGCMGQTLAMDEMKILLVMLARWLDFELVGHEPREEPLFPHTDMDLKLGKHAHQIMTFTATPIGPVQMRVTKAVRKD